MRTVKMTNYSVSQRGYEGLGKLVEEYGFKKVVLVGGKRALGSVSQKIRDGIKGSSVEVLGEFVYGHECTLNNINALMEKEEVQKADVIFAVGGGKALDTGKVLAGFLNKPSMSFPTICSNCAGGTAIAVVYNDDGSFLRYELIPAPVHMFVEVETIAEAPEKYFWAGIGDGLSKQPEVLFATKGLEDLDFVANMGVSIAKTCQEPFLKYGEEGLKDVRENKASKAVEEVATDILVNTGYVSNLTNGDKYYYNSSLAHVFYNVSTSVKREGEYLHGVLVSYGVLVLHAYDHNYEEFEKLARFNKKLGLPVTLEEIGLTRDDVREMAKKVYDTTEWQKSEKALSEEKFVEAAFYADDFGKKLLAE